MRTVYLNGQYLPENEASVSIFDRGFLMADGIYEVTSVLGGKLIDFEGHAVRLQRSLDALDMRSPISKEDLLEVHRELVRLNGITVEGSGVWAGNTNYTINDGTGSTQMRVDSDCSLVGLPCCAMPAPTPSP